MQKIIVLSLLASLPFSGSALASACDASNPEEMAQVYGIDGSTITEEKTYQRKTTSECLWSFKDKQGFGISVTYRTFDKTAKITNPDFFKNNQKHLVKNGKKVGKWDLQYRFEDFPNTEHGVLSNSYGNKYTSSLHYVWVKGEQRRLSVTYSVTVNEAGDFREPTTDELKKAVAIFTD